VLSFRAAFPTPPTALPKTITANPHSARDTPNDSADFSTAKKSAPAARHLSANYALFGGMPHWWEQRFAGGVLVVT
jgi:hypothetical protein